MEIAHPPIQTPTAKEKKYDRQLRLWGAAGQRALEEAHVLLIVGHDPARPTPGTNSSVTGGEALKNLVLPGIGRFSIADMATVTEADLGVNFFLEAESLGKNRGLEATRLLNELNPDVKGQSVGHCGDLEQWAGEQNVIFSEYTLIIICAPFPSKLLQRLRDSAAVSGTPIIYLHCAGFYSYFSVELPYPFPVVETHPDPESTQDLRLLAPWAALSAEVSKLGDLKEKDDHEHGHVPYILLILYYLEQWKVTHSGSLPNTFKEKTQFREFVRDEARVNNPEGGEENFDEACAAVLKTLNPPPIGNGCKELFAMSDCKELRKDSGNFWIIANAIKTFYERHHCLPLPGSLPDMKAGSADYISLQNIYKSKARADAAEVLLEVRGIEQSLQRTVDIPSIPEEEVDLFCKNAAHVKVLPRTPSIQALLEKPEVLSALEGSLDDPNALEPHLTPIFMALVQTDTVIDDNTKSKLRELLTDCNEAEEVDRACHGELHNIASLTGGQVAQEAIKLITRQYLPVNSLCIFDGISSRSEVLKFSYEAGKASLS